MTALRAPWMLAGLVGSVLLLIVALVVLVWQQGPGPLAKTLTLADTSSVNGHHFPSDFGRLSDLVPFTGGISPVASGVVPVAHGPEFRDSDWVKAQVPMDWTLQVLASQDEGAVKRFLTSLDNRADFVYFTHPQDGQDWYVVTTGVFSSREQAIGVGASMMLPDGARPFPRSMSSYQEALRAAEAPAFVPAEESAVVPEESLPVMP